MGGGILTSSSAALPGEWCRGGGQTAPLVERRPLRKEATLQLQAGGSLGKALNRERARERSTEL